MSDHFVDLDVAVHVLLDHAGQFASTLDATERAAAPHASRHQLERPRGDFLTGPGHADNRGFSPTLVAAFERRTHQIDVAYGFERVVHSAAGEFDHDVLNRGVVVTGVDEIRGSQCRGHLRLVRVDVDGENTAGVGHYSALNHAQTDTAESEHGHRRACFHLGGMEHGTDPRGDSAAEQADFLQRRVPADFRHRDLGQYRVFGERRRTHEVQDLPAVAVEPTGSVRHQSLTLGGANGLTEIGLAGSTERAFAAFRGIQRDNVVAGLYAGDAFAHLLDYCAALVTEDRRECAFRVLAGQGVGIRVANTRCNDAYQHLARLRPVEVDLFDGQGLPGSPGYGRSSFHCRSSLYYLLTGFGGVYRHNSVTQTDSRVRPSGGTGSPASSINFRSSAAVSGCAIDDCTPTLTRPSA